MTMTGDLPPSSTVTFFRLPAAALTISRPTSVEPVKVILSTPGCAASAAPAVGPRPVTMLKTPLGKPASSTSSPSRSAVSGVSSAGLSTTVQPAASAGALFQVASSSGKFQAMMAPTTPTGSRCEKATYSCPGTSVPEIGSVCPSSLVGQPAM